MQKRDRVKIYEEVKMRSKYRKMNRQERDVVLTLLCWVLHTLQNEIVLGIRYRSVFLNICETAAR